MADVDSYDKFIPFCTSSKVLGRTEPLKGLELSDVFSMDAELTVGFLSFAESYVSKVICSPYDSVKVSLSPRGAPHLCELTPFSPVRLSRPLLHLSSELLKPPGNLSLLRMPLGSRSLLSSDTISPLPLRTPFTPLSLQNSSNRFQA